MKQPLYGALTLMLVYLHATIEHPKNLPGYDTGENAETEILEILSHLEPQEQELILAELEEPTRQKLKNKIFNCLQVKNQLIANNLQVCNDTVLNNLTVNGTCSGIVCTTPPTVICGVPACVIADLIISATSADIPNTLVLRDGNGSFASTTITLTGLLELQAQDGTTVSVTASPATASYIMLLPTTFGTSSSVLTADGNDPSRLSWQTFTGIVTSTINLFGDVIGSSTATIIKTICGFNACNLVTTITTATSADIPLTLVLRDATGSFAATTVTLTGCLILQDSTGAAGGKMCATPNALIVAPLGARALQATASGNTRGTNAVDLQINNGGTTTVASGNFSVITGGASNTAQGQYDVVSGGQDNTISIVSPSIDPQAGYNMISSGSNNNIMINDITNNNNICGYNSIGGAANSITISTAATTTGITTGFNSIGSGKQNNITVSLPTSNFTPNTLVANIPVGTSPATVAVTPNGEFAYVANNSFNGTISVIDVATNTVASIPAGEGPIALAITPNGQYAYITNFNAQHANVSILDLATNTLLTTSIFIDGYAPRAMAITPNGQFAYITNENTNQIKVIDLTTNTLFATLSETVPGSFNPIGVAITPNGQFAYVANYNNGNPGTVSVIDIATNTIVDTINVANGPVGIAITPNGQFAYTANYSGSVSVIDLATNTVVDTIALGGTNPFGITITPNGQFAYVSHFNNGPGFVIVIEIATNKVVDTIPVGRGAQGITVTPNGQVVYVTNFNSNTVSAIFTELPVLGDNVIGGGLQNQITVSPQPASVGQNVIAGGFSNTITSTNNGIGVGSCIGGGSTNTIYSSPGVIGGGYLNTIVPGGYLGTIGGGQYNQAGCKAFIGGGQGNVASGIFSVVGGGNSNSATGSSAAVLGGAGNSASGNYSVALGAVCTATGDYSFALGSNCTTTYNNTFIWGDGSTLFTATASNTFSVLAAHGARFITSLSNLTQGVQLLPGSGAWVSACDKTKKANYQKVDGVAVLEKVATLPIETWNYTTQDATIRHMGPYAQDFHAAFCLGEDPLGINTIDADGVDLAAIQGLYTLHQTQLQINTQLMQDIAALQKEIAELEAKINKNI